MLTEHAKDCNRFLKTGSYAPNVDGPASADKAPERLPESVVRAVEMAEKMLRPGQAMLRETTLAVVVAAILGDELREEMRAAVKAGESTVEAKREGFKAGVNTNVEVLDAVRDLYGSERDYISAKYQFILSNLELKRVSGQLEVADLERVNGWLEQ